MLSAHDAALAARDPALPGLALLLDADALADRLRALLPGEEIIHADPIYLRYKPGTSCIAGFRLVRAGQDPVEFYAKAHDRDHYAVVAGQSERARMPTAAGPARRLIHDLALVVRFFPNDRELKGMRRVGDPERRPRLFRRLFRDKPKLWESQLETLRYKPERRFVGKLIRKNRPAGLIKVYADAGYGAALAGASFASAIGGAKLLGALAAHRVIALSWLPGVPLNEHWSDAAAVASAVKGAGVRIAKAHAMGVNPPAIQTRQWEAAAALQSAEALAALCPRLGAKAQELAGRAAADLISAPLKPCLIHGDFSADQVVVDGDAIGIIDWDNAASGDAAADLGSFIAGLETDAIYGTFPRGAAEGTADALREGYENAAGSLPTTVDIQTIVHLIRLAPEGFRNRLADWPERTEALLDRAEAIYRRACRGDSGERGGHLRRARTG